ncbi:MAG: hypothetical protein R2864_10300 [Syntrophotaleaceae bacterium]
MLNVERPETVFRVDARNIPKESLRLKSDLAAEYPVYVYVNDESTVVFYSLSIESLLNCNKISRPLRVSEFAVSFVLQKGVIPPPFTIYKNIYILSVGDEARIESSGNNIRISFSHKFPFRKGAVLNKNSGILDISSILESLVNATQDRLKKNRPAFLFHSAGKDSNLLAVALAEAGLQAGYTLVTLRSNLANDESDISKKIAKYLGFKHVVLNEPSGLDRVDVKYLNQYFGTVPFPVFDKVSLAYPLYLRQLPQLEGSNVVDGGGNDAYLGMLPRPFIRFAFRTSTVRSWFRPIVEKYFFSTSSLNPATATKFDWVGFYGLTSRDSTTIYPQTVNLNDYINGQMIQREGWDDYDFFTDILTTIIASESHIRKFRNGASMWNANPVLPYTNESVVECMQRVPDFEMLDRKLGKNKLFIRNYLRESIGLDSDEIGKISYPFDSWPMIKSIQDAVENEIYNCGLFSSKIKKLYRKILFQSRLNNLRGARARNIYHRMYILSSWFNQSKYIN